MHVNKQHQLMIKNTVMEFITFYCFKYISKNTFTITKNTKYVSDKSTKIALVTWFVYFYFCFLILNQLLIIWLKFELE